MELRQKKLIYAVGVEHLKINEINKTPINDVINVRFFFQKESLFNTDFIDCILKAGSLKSMMIVT